jgi:hypothetical protein
LLASSAVYFAMSDRLVLCLYPSCFNAAEIEQVVYQPQ